MNRINFKYIKKEHYNLSLLISIIAIVVYYHIIYQETGNTNNLKFYIGSCFIFCIVYFVSSFFERFFNYSQFYSGIISFSLCIFFVIWGIGMYNNEEGMESYPVVGLGTFRHSIGGGLYFIIILLFSMLTMISIWKYGRISCETKFIRFIAVLLFCLFQSLLVYSPNMLYDQFGGLYHLHAYTNSIVGVLHHQPYSHYFKSDYGHYALFYYFPVKFLRLFGLDQLHAVNIVMAVFSGIMFACFYILLSKNIRNDYVYILSVLAGANINIQFFSSGNNFIYIPGRYMFVPIVMLAIYSYVMTDRYKLLCNILVCLSILFAFDVGFTLAIVWILSQLCHVYCFEKIDKRNIFELLVGAVAFVFVIPYFIVTIYNLAVGGTWNTVKDYLYPLPETAEGILSSPLKWNDWWAPHSIVAIIFLGILCINMMRVLTGNYVRIRVFAMINSLCGLGLMCYSMERYCLGNFGVVFFNFIFAIFYILQMGLKCVDEKELKFGLASAIKVIELPIFSAMFVSLMLATCLILGTITNISTPLRYRINQTWDHEGYSSYVNTINENIPKDIIGVGTEVPELYESMGRNCEVYILDWSNIVLLPGFLTEMTGYIYDRMAERNNILVETTAEEYLGLTAAYMRVKRFSYVTGYTVDYMEKMEPSQNIEDAILQYTSNESISDRDFVYISYLNAKNYEPSEEEVNLCIDKLENGYKREDIIIELYGNQQGD